MKLLIIGGNGMLGHRAFIDLSRDFSVKATLREGPSAYKPFNLFDESNSYFNVDVRDFAAVSTAILDYQPDVVINAAGVVKQRDLAKQSIPCLAINALFPHQLEAFCEEEGIRVITFSTDCVFSGLKGNYTEEDLPDPIDLYGRTKLLGELHSEHCVTIRSSIIGLERSNFQSLIEWFLRQHGTIQGYQKAIYSGITTYEMVRVIKLIITKFPALYGLWHVASAPITKYDLLTQFNLQLADHDVMIEADDTLMCDRSLCADCFNDITGYHPPSWERQLTELAQAANDRVVLVNP